MGSTARALLPAGARDLLHSIQTGSVAHPDSFPVGTRGSFPESKAAGWGMKLTTQLHLVTRSRMVELHLYFPTPLHVTVLSYFSTRTTLSSLRYLFTIYSTTLSVAQSTERRRARLLNYNLERMSKKEALAKLNVLSRHCLKVLRTSSKNSVTIDGFRDEV
jgi:hypothetical protein